MKSPKPNQTLVQVFLAEIGRKGGSAKSERKTRASRRNARRGGWPKGKPRKPKAHVRRPNEKGQR